MRLVLLIAGVGALLIGARLALRVRHWSPRISPDLSDYDPGPDVFDWARAVAPIVVGLGLVVIALSA